MSQVHYHRLHYTLTELAASLADEDEVLIVSGPLETKVYRQVVFPKKTRYDARSEDVYQEFATAYDVLDIIRPGTLKRRDRFWTWTEQANGLKDVQRYHEEGLSRSPVAGEDYSFRKTQATEQKSPTGRPSFPPTNTGGQRSISGP